jgi:hypothetical protein
MAHLYQFECEDEKKQRDWSPEWLHLVHVFRRIKPIHETQHYIWYDYHNTPTLHHVNHFIGQHDEILIPYLDPIPIPVPGSFQCCNMEWSRDVMFSLLSLVVIVICDCDCNCNCMWVRPYTRTLLLDKIATGWANNSQKFLNKIFSLSRDLNFIHNSDNPTGPVSTNSIEQGWTVLLFH